MPAFNKNQLADAIQRAAKGNIIDRLVAWRDPVKGLARQQARMSMALTGSYIGASKTRASFSSWFASGKSADDDLLPELATLRQRSRDLERNNPLACGAINTVVTSVVGTGLRLQSTLDSEVLGLSEDETSALQKQVEFEFRLWAESKDCSLDRRLNFAEFCELAFRNTLSNGEAFVLTPVQPIKGNPYKTRLQIVEADRVVNRKRQKDSVSKVAGIHLDTHGAPKALDILTAHPGNFGEKEKWETFDYYGKKTGRRNVIHLYEMRRPGQTRGVPYLAPVIEPLKQLGRYTEAELTAAVVSGLFTLFIKTPEGRGSMLGPEDVAARSNQQRDYALGSGAVLEGLPGDEVETINPGRPNDSFDPFVTACLRQIGAALEIPMELLIKHFMSSYTAARAALLEAWKFFKKRRRWLANNLCQPVFETVLAEAVLAGRINMPGFFADARLRKAYCSATWHGDGMGLLNPKDEMAAASGRMDAGITTLPEEIAAYDGGDWESKHKVQTKVAAARREAGLVLNAAGDPLGDESADQPGDDQDKT